MLKFLALFLTCEYYNGFLVVKTDNKDFYYKAMASECLVNSSITIDMQVGKEYKMYFNENCEDSLIKSIK